MGPKYTVSRWYAKAVLFSCVVRPRGPGPPRRCRPPAPRGGAPGGGGGGVGGGGGGGGGMAARGYTQTRMAQEAAWCTERRRLWGFHKQDVDRGRLRCRSVLRNRPGIRQKQRGASQTNVAEAEGLGFLGCPASNPNFRQLRKPRKPPLRPWSPVQVLRRGFASAGEWDCPKGERAPLPDSLWDFSKRGGRARVCTRLFSACAYRTTKGPPHVVARFVAPSSPYLLYNKPSNQEVSSPALAQSKRLCGELGVPEFS